MHVLLVLNSSHPAVQSEVTKSNVTKVIIFDLHHNIIANIRYVCHYMAPAPRTPIATAIGGLLNRVSNVYSLKSSTLTMYSVPTSPTAL